MPYGLGIAKGMMVTLRNLVRKPVTVQYPEQRVAQHHRFRGEDFVWYEERCTGCASCAKYCPQGIIKIVTAPSGEMTQEGEKYKLEVFDIEIGGACSAAFAWRRAPTTPSTWAAASSERGHGSPTWSSPSMS